MAEVKWTDQALDDLDNIAEFIAKDSEKYARIQIERFFSAVKILESQTRSGRILEELQDEAIREIVQGNYRIIYRIISDMRIDILTVHHSRRLLHNNPVFKKKN